MKIRSRDRRLLAALGCSAVILVFQAAAAQARLAREVGVEAQGIDPQSALKNRLKLDLRDSRNRPVSARLMERELKAASAHLAADATFVSNLPKARAATLLSELLEALGVVFKTEPLPLPSAFRAQSILTKPPKLMIVVLLLGLILTAVSPGLRPAAARHNGASRAPLVLRC